MDLLEFSAKMTEVMVWPASIAVTAVVMYLNRGKGGEFFGDFVKRLKQLEVGAVKVSLAETSSIPALSAEIKEANYKKYTNGVIVQRFWFVTIQDGKEFSFSYPISFPNEVTSFQFVGRAPLPIKSFTKDTFVVDASSCKPPFRIEVIITGM